MSVVSTTCEDQIFSNMVRTLVLGMTNGAFVSVPVSGPQATYYRRLMAGEMPIHAVDLPGGARIWASEVGEVELPAGCDDRFVDGTDVVSRWAVTAAERAIADSSLHPDPLRTDPVAYVDNSCVGCGVCGEIAHAAILCPSFFRADVIYNPSAWDRRKQKIRGTVIGWLQGRHDRARQARLQTLISP